jgi:hypothetical protein
VKNGPGKGSVAKQTNWEMVEKRLKEVRRRTLPMTDTSEAIKRFRLSWQIAQKANENLRKTGLVEQQACFRILRERES